VNKREQLLAVAVGALFVLMAVYFLFGWASDSLKSKRQRVQKLETELEQTEEEIARGDRAAELIAQLEKRSLPRNVDVARSQYLSWLLAQVESVELNDPDVKAVASRPHGDVYHHLSFTVHGQGNLDQLTRLLHQFYTVRHLHRIHRLVIKPIEGTRQLDLTFTIDALVLPGAEDRQTLSDEKSDRLACENLSDYTDAILGRNLFGPANQTPRLSIGNETVHRGRTLTKTIKASDSDPLDTVTYRLGDSSPPGATLDATSGSFRFGADKLGKYEVTVHATDDGMPPKTATETFLITVVEPPVVRDTPREPRFDDAKHTYVSAITEVNGRPQVWLSVRTTGKLDRLHKGDSVDVGSVKGVITRIGSTEVELTINGQRRIVSLGQNLSELREP